MRLRQKSILPLGILLLLAGCPGAPSRINAAGNYPTMGESRPNRDQRTTLVIATSTFYDPNLSDDAGAIIRHSGYTIYDERGEAVEHVRNYIGINDRGPTTVELEPGRYLILLESPEKQPPIFRVILEPGKLTTVTLPR
jgi:hypothetical protein